MFAEAVAAEVRQALNERRKPVIDGIAVPFFTLNLPQDDGDPFPRSLPVPAHKTDDVHAWSVAQHDDHLTRFFAACNLVVDQDADGTWKWLAIEDGNWDNRVPGESGDLLSALDAAENAALALAIPRGSDLIPRYDRLTAARDQAARRGEHADREFRMAVRADVAAGANVTWLAEVAGISRERVYQIRDNRR